MITSNLWDISNMYKNNREGNFQSSASQIWEYFGDNGHVADDDECHEGGGLTEMQTMISMVMIDDEDDE